MLNKGAECGKPRGKQPKELIVNVVASENAKKKRKYKNRAGRGKP